MAIHTLEFRAADGEGTSYAAYVVTLTVTPVQLNGVYQLSTKEELFWFRDAVNGGQYSLNAALTQDIDLEGTADWVRIANGSSSNSGRAYTGTFDGQNHTIKNLSIKNTSSSSGKYLALFERVVGKGRISAKYSNYGGICADTTSTSKIIGCSNAAAIEGDGSYLGGIAGANAGEITDCVNTGRVAGAKSYQTEAGGIAGRNSKLIDRCANTGEVYAESARVGGIAGGATSSSSQVKNSWNGGSVTLNVRLSSSDPQVGGIMGYTQGTVENCCSTGTITVTMDNADGKTVGSIAGKADGSKAAVTNCYASVAAPFNQAVGSGSTAAITNCYYVGEEDAFDGTTVKTAEEMKQAAFAALLGEAFKSGCQSLPVLTWQEAAPHTIEILPAVAPTYDSTGLTEGQKCSVCSEILVEQVEIPKLKRPTPVLPITPSKPGTPKDDKPAAGSSFTDVKTGIWYAEAVKYVSEKGLMNGTSASSFGPSTTTTRGMIVTILARIEGVNTSTRAQVAAILMRFMENIAK